MPLLNVSLDACMTAQAELENLLEQQSLPGLQRVYNVIMDALLDETVSTPAGECICSIL